MCSNEIADRFVTLREGVIWPASAYLLMWKLEAGGFDVGPTLEIVPPGYLTPEDLDTFIRWKKHLGVLFDETNEIAGFF